jgi:hypothetical protein
MDAAIFFLPVALVVSLYLMPVHKSRPGVLRDAAHSERCDA